MLHLEFSSVIYTDFQLDDIVTPVKVDMLEDLLRFYQMEQEELNFIVNGFRYGFGLGFRGPQHRKNISRNLRLWVGNKYDLWDKMMKEVKLHRFAGPFEQIPYEEFVQSPVGLDEKASGQTGQGADMAKADMKLAFRHLPIRSEDRKWLVMKTVNPWEPEEKAYYFTDKCTPFGSSISCANIQRVSNAIAFIFGY